MRTAVNLLRASGVGLAAALVVGSPVAAVAASLAIGLSVWAWQETRGWWR